jgi:hypothetical protein
MDLGPELFPGTPRSFAGAESATPGCFDHDRIACLHFDLITARKFQSLAVLPLHPVPAPITVRAAPQAMGRDSPPIGQDRSRHRLQET